MGDFFVNKNNEATKSRGKVLSFMPTSELYFTKGVKAFHRRELGKARKYLERAIQLEPMEPMIYCQLAIVLTEEGNYQHSNQLLLKIIQELDPLMYECYYLLANNYAFLGLFKEAYHYANEYLKYAPNGEFSEDALDLLDLMEVEEDLDEYSEEDELIVKQDNAKALLESGDFQNAVGLLEEITNEFPEFWPAYNNLALAYFYLGETKKAEKVLEDVLSKNPGNLHAFCNMLVFSHFQQQDTNHLAQALEKVHPISFEHRFKLGATFAVIGRYDLAYKWLKSLMKSGFEGDHSFYYWLSLSAYKLGNIQYAEHIWNKVVDLNPEKAGLEPWKNEDTKEGIEIDEEFIKMRLKSQDLSERLFGYFLFSIYFSSEKKIKRYVKTDFEKEFLQAIYGSKNDINESSAYDMYQTALHLYHRNQPISFYESSLFHLCFIIMKQVQNIYSTKNTKAWACAIEYIWKKYRSEKITQKELARNYEISPSTLAKYVKLVQKVLS